MQEQPRGLVDQVHVSPAVQGYILALVRNTRALAENRFRGNRATESRRTANIGVHFDE